MALDTLVGEIFFRLSRDLSIPREHRVERLHPLEPLTVTHHPPKSGGHKHCGSGDIFLVV